MSWSTREAVDLVGCPFGRADMWLRTGLIRCRYDGFGSGSRRRWTAKQVVALGLVAEMAELGLLPNTPTRRKEVAAITAELYRRPWPEVLVIERGQPVRLTLEEALGRLQLEDGVCRTLIRPALIAEKLGIEVR